METGNRAQGGIRRVVIAGGGTSGVGDATIPTLVTFHRLLEINEQEFMAATQGTFKLGIGFENWRDVGQDYVHSFGITGKDHWTAGFQNFWLKGRDRKLARDYGDYCLELRASLEGGFAHLPRGGMNYAFHIDASLYAKFVTRRQDTPFWRSCRAMDIPDSLRHRLELFRETGRVFRVPNELFAENSWIQVMLGQGIEPQQHHPVADLMGDEELSRFLDGIKLSVQKTVAQLPAHQAYVEQYCKAHSE